MSYGPWNPEGYPGQQQPGQPMHSMRASHTDRERAIDVLKAGFSEGRLHQEEYEARLTRASSAETYGELHQLLADLPQGPVPMPAPAPAPIQPYVAQPPVARTFLPAPLPKTNGSAIGALVCGILTPMYGLTAIPAVILGHKAKAEIKRNGEEGSGLATAGLVMGWLAIGVALMIVLIAVGAS